MTAEMNELCVARLTRLYDVVAGSAGRLENDVVAKTDLAELCALWRVGGENAETHDEIDGDDAEIAENVESVEIAEKSEMSENASACGGGALLCGG